jgi:hypothetical protein
MIITTDGYAAAEKDGVALLGGLEDGSFDLGGVIAD